MRNVMALAALVLIVGCSPAASGTSTPGPAATPGPASIPAPATSAATPQPSDPVAGPPVATLTGNGAPVTGWLGTYCWDGLCADVFDVPPAADLPPVGAGAELEFEVAAPFLSWSASYSADGATERTELGGGGSDFDPDTDATIPPPLTTASFAAPPSGDWLVIVQVFFENGDAQYAWHVAVP